MSDNEKRNEWKEREVGALWVQKSARGQKYMTGHVSINPNASENTKVVIFENTGKKDENGNVRNEKAPDFRVYLSESAEGKGSSTKPQAQEAPKEAATASLPETEEEVLF